MFESNTFGTALKISVEGESHSQYIGFSLEGIPSGLKIDFEALRRFMERRAPGRNNLSTSRKESDEVEFLSGVTSEGITTGGIIKARIANKDVKVSDYKSIRTIPRPGHADFGQYVQKGFISSGGGANSGRMTATLCAAGWVAMTFLKFNKINVNATVESIGGKVSDFEQTILAAAENGDSVGGTIACEVRGLAPGIGGALFSGFESRLSAAIFAVPGVKGIEFGNGFEACSLRGSENNDAFKIEDGRVVTLTNRHGGVLGGMTTGMPLVFRVAIKPTPTIFINQQSVDLSTMTNALCSVKGRHDPCIVLRATPVVEAIAALVAADMILEKRKKSPPICLTLTSSDVKGCKKEFFSQYPFAEMAEIRLDLLSEDERLKAASLAKELGVPTILCFRRKCDGGAYEGSEEKRIELFLKLLKDDAPFSYVDLEDDFRCALVEDAADKAGVRVIRSLHIFDASKKIDLISESRRLRGKSSDIPKIAYKVESEKEVEEFFSQTINFTEFEHIFCIMGDIGKKTRFEAHRSNSMLVYTSTGALGNLGHVSPQDLVLIRSRKTGANKFAVVGHPVAHSLSPLIHAANFSSLGYEGSYEKFDVKPEDLCDFIEKAKREGYLGLNVTVPHKVAVLDFLDEADENVKRYGSCNTLYFRGDGKTVGFNTDINGFLEVLKENDFDIRDKKVLCFGCGGAGRAIALCSAYGGAKSVTLAALRQERAVSLADEIKKIGVQSSVLLSPVEDSLNARMSVWKKNALEADLIVNATPVGLGDNDEPLLKSDAFRPGQFVLDMIPTRRFPPTASQAFKAGAKAFGGLEFLVSQGAKSFEIWTGLKADKNAMLQSIREN